MLPAHTAKDQRVLAVGRSALRELVSPYFAAKRISSAVSVLKVWTGAVSETSWQAIREYEFVVTGLARIRGSWGYLRHHGLSFVGT